MATLNGIVTILDLATEDTITYCRRLQAVLARPHWSYKRDGQTGRNGAPGMCVELDVKRHQPIPSHPSQSAARPSETGDADLSRIALMNESRSAEPPSPDSPMPLKSIWEPKRFAVLCGDRKSVV